MDELLTSFAVQEVTPAQAPDQAPDYNDSQVQRRLHDLGYLE